MAKYSQEDIIETLKNLAALLGKTTLSKKDVGTAIPVSTVESRFGNLGNALEAAGLVRTERAAHLTGKGTTLTDAEIFGALYEVELTLGREPGFNACQAQCKYSIRPYKKRFGKWGNVLLYYRKWKSENKHLLSAKSSQEALTGSQEPDKGGELQEVSCVPIQPIGINKKKTPEQLFGEPIEFRGLRHAPTNEQGVVFLFGMVSRELGFNIEAVQTGFPDCEGKYLYDAKKNFWAKARIEFEYKASNFELHSHDPNQCDFVICWINDWADCPVNVIELKSEILKLRSRFPITE